MDEAHSRRFDLCERTAQFGESVIRSCRELRADPVSAPIIRQLVRAATSIGANYVEADEAGSRKEFKYRISVCKREAKETQHWLRMLVAAEPAHRDKSAELWKEAQELLLILSSIHRKTNERD